MSILLTMFAFTVMILTMSGGIIRAIINFIYPKICVVCKLKLDDKTAIDTAICGNCWGKIKRNLPPFCHSCGRHLDKKRIAKNICTGCLKTKLYFDRAFSPCIYEGTVKELIHAFKYQNKDYLSKTLYKLLSEFIKEYSLPVSFVDAIVPVPLHKTRLREREFNQAEILCRHIASEFNKDLLSNVLIRKRMTKTQTELKPQERFKNVSESFTVPDNKLIQGKNILLVDDVLTTGATSSEAALALKNAGARVVFVLTLAN